MKSPLMFAATAGILLGLAGCAATPPPTMQTGPEAEVTVDGLYRVDNSVMALAYVKPSLTLQGYTKLMIDDVVVAYKKDPEGRRRDSPGGVGAERNYALSPSQMDVLKNLFQEAVVKELTKDDGYQLVDAPAPDVLRIDCYLIDLVVKSPTQNTAGRQQNFASSYAEVTVVFELHDSESEEVLARVADRGDPTVTGGASGELASVNAAFVRTDLTKMFEYWAGLLRAGMDNIYEAPLP